MHNWRYRNAPDIGTLLSRYLAESTELAVAAVLCRSSSIRKVARARVVNGVVSADDEPSDGIILRQEFITSRYR